MELIIDEGIAHLSIKKNLVASNVKELVEKMKANLPDDLAFDSLVIDIKTTESIDSMGVTFLVGVYKNFTQKGKKIKLIGVSLAMLELFKIMKLNEIFDIEIRETGN